MVSNSIKQFYQGKRVLIFGLGLLGGALGDTKFFCDLGAEVRVTDAKNEDQLRSSLEQLSGLPITYTLGGHSIEDIKWADIIIRNPSIPWKHPLLEMGRELGKQIEMRTSLLLRLAPVFSIGVTGTRGKTTTTMMIYSMFSSLLTDKKVLLGGNIAHQSDLQLLHQIEDPQNTVLILELSSWQLQGFRENRLSPNVAVITNLYPDHLNSYESLGEYYDDKRAILEFQNPSDTAILNDRQQEFHQWSSEILSTVRWFSVNDIPITTELSIPGEHNRENAAAALAAADVLGIDRLAAIQYLQKFNGVPYRQQLVRFFNGVRYVNDTTATTPVALCTALKTFPNSIVICGGTDKNLPIDELITALNTSVKRIILLPGNGTERIKAHIYPHLITAEASSMKEAVEHAKMNAVSGDTVLLSPGFTSFGLFSNEFDRGEQFTQCVKDLS